MYKEYEIGRLVKDQGGITRSLRITCGLLVETGAYRFDVRGLGLSPKISNRRRMTTERRRNSSQGLACRAITYQVQSAQVVSEGTPVANTPGARWHLSPAGRSTPSGIPRQRLLVLATEVSGSTTAQAVSVASTPPVPTAAVPAALAGVDSLAANPAPLGALSISGSPTATYSESPGPLADAAVAQTVYFAGLRAARAADVSEWATVGPSR